MKTINKSFKNSWIGTNMFIKKRFTTLKTNIVHLVLKTTQNNPLVFHWKLFTFSLCCWNFTFFIVKKKKKISYIVHTTNSEWNIFYKETISKVSCLFKNFDKFTAIHQSRGRFFCVCFIVCAFCLFFIFGLLEAKKYKKSRVLT